MRVRFNGTMMDLVNTARSLFAVSVSIGDAVVTFEFPKSYQASRFRDVAARSGFVVEGPTTDVITDTFLVDVVTD